jgi:hypothetical protein
LTTHNTQVIISTRRNKVSSSGNILKPGQIVLTLNIVAAPGFDL